MSFPVPGNPLDLFLGDLLSLDVLVDKGVVRLGDLLDHQLTVAADLLDHLFGYRAPLRWLQRVILKHKGLFLDQVNHADIRACSALMGIRVAPVLGRREDHLKKGSPA